MVRNKTFFTSLLMVTAATASLTVASPAVASHTTPVTHECIVAPWTWPVHPGDDCHPTLDKDYVVGVGDNILFTNTLTSGVECIRVGLYDALAPPGSPWIFMSSLAPGESAGHGSLAPGLYRIHMERGISTGAPWFNCGAFDSSPMGEKTYYMLVNDECAHQKFTECFTGLVQIGPLPDPWICQDVPMPGPPVPQTTLSPSVCAGAQPPMQDCKAAIAVAPRANEYQAIALCRSPTGGNQVCTGPWTPGSNPSGPCIP